MPSKHIPASFTSRSFSCPHCGTLTHQSWFKVAAAGVSSQEILDLERFEKIKTLINTDKRVCLTRHPAAASVCVQNLYFSNCYTCGDLAIWNRDILLYPNERYDVEPNADIPDDVKADFEEARQIVNLSPRGAAALLRLCVQKLCNSLLGRETAINEAISELVSKGLNEQIQQALDSVRVIGNHAVHPGKIDLRDDRDTAKVLFELVNLIAEELISRPKRLAAIYDIVPPETKAQIAKRDARARGPSNS